MERDTAFLTMELTSEMAEQFKIYPFFLEIEMLQGGIELLPNGIKKYTIEINDSYKAELIKEFCLKIISNSHNACKQ